MSYYPGPESHIRDKVRVVLDLRNHSIKKIQNITFDKLDTNKLANVSTCLNNTKTKVDDLDTGKLITFPVKLTKVSDVVINEGVKNTELSILKTKVNKLDKKIPVTTFNSN